MLWQIPTHPYQVPGETVCNHSFKELAHSVEKNDGPVCGRRVCRECLVSITRCGQTVDGDERFGDYIPGDSALVRPPERPLSNDGRLPAEIMV